ncbi:MAG: YgaP family membrane protein [Acidiferrobacteraceae bacterium]
MFYVRNVPGWERGLRIAGGVAVSGYALGDIGGPWGWVLGAGGAGLALSGVLGFCPMCALAGRRLEPRARATKRDG